MKISSLEFYSADAPWSFSPVSSMEALGALFGKTRRAKWYSAATEHGKPVGPWTIDEPAGAELYEFTPGKIELTAEDLQAACNTVHERLLEAGYKVRGSLRFTLIFVKGEKDRYWVAVSDSYQSGEGGSIPWG